jgi:hypothetical protein
MKSRQASARDLRNQKMHERAVHNAARNLLVNRRSRDFVILKKSIFHGTERPRFR